MLLDVVFLCALFSELLPFHGCCQIFYHNDIEHVLSIIPAYCTDAFIIYLKWAYPKVDSFCTIVGLLWNLVKTFLCSVGLFYLYTFQLRGTYLTSIDRLRQPFMEVSWCVAWFSCVRVCVTRLSKKSAIKAIV